MFLRQNHKRLIDFILTITAGRWGGFWAVRDFGVLFMIMFSLVLIFVWDGYGFGRVCGVF